MPLVDYTNRVTMSFSDINVELGKLYNKTIDIQGAAASFSGISTSELTEGLGESSLELKEFFGQDFALGGQTGTRNPHTIHWLTDADAGGSGGLRAYSLDELVYAAELIAAPKTGTATVFTQNATKYPDDYIDNDLRVNDVIYNGSTGTTKFPSSVSLFGLRGGGEYWFADSTANKVYQVSSANNGKVVEVYSRTPATPTNIEEVSKDDSSIEIRITGPTEVARTLRIYKSENGGAYTSITKTGTGAGGSDFQSGAAGNSSIAITHTFTGLNDNTPYTFYGRFENAFANGADGSTLTITTDTDPYFVNVTPSSFNGDSIGNIETVGTADVVVGSPDNPWIYLSSGSSTYNSFRVAVSTDGGSTYGSYGSWRTPSGNSSYASSKMLAGATDTHFRIQFRIDNEHEDPSFSSEYTIYNRESGVFQRSATVSIIENLF